MENTSWNTSISNIQPNSIEIRGYDIGELIGNVSFAEQIFLVITGELPSKQVAAVFEAILCASIDHGAGSPSALAARTAISGGAALNGAAAVGLLTMGDHHGAAVQNCMRAILDLTVRAELDNSLDRVITDQIEVWVLEGKNFPGIGHRVHSKDPRVARLLQIAEQNGLKGKYVNCVTRISELLTERKGKPIPVNIDGITAALLCEIQFPIDFANVVFMISRIVGVFTQANEEKTTMKPMRRIDPIQIKYTGKTSRRLENRKGKDK